MSLPTAGPAPQALVPPRFLPGLGQLPRHQHLLPNSLGYMETLTVMRQRWDISKCAINNTNKIKKFKQRCWPKNIDLSILSDSITFNLTLFQTMWCYDVLWKTMIWVCVHMCKRNLYCWTWYQHVQCTNLTDSMLNLPTNIPSGQYGQ